MHGSLVHEKLSTGLSDYDLSPAAIRDGIAHTFSLAVNH